MTEHHSASPEDDAPPQSFAPDENIVTAFKDRTTAEKVKQALVDEGFKKDDIDLVDGAFAAIGEERIKERRGNLAAIFSSAEREHTRDYREFAANGGYVMLIHARNQGQIDTAKHVLARLKAHHPRHYGKRTVTDLS